MRVNALGWLARLLGTDDVYPRDGCKPPNQQVGEVWPTEPTLPKEHRTVDWHAFQNEIWEQLRLRPGI